MTEATEELLKAFPKVWCPNCGAAQPVEIVAARVRLQIPRVPLSNQACEVMRAEG
jgi:hypothetical protein